MKKFIEPKKKMQNKIFFFFQNIPPLDSRRDIYIHYLLLIFNNISLDFFGDKTTFGKLIQVFFHI